MEPSESRPYTIEPVDERRVVVRFAAICDQARTKQHEDELTRLVESYSAVACDLSQTAVISTDWLRWLSRLTTKARLTGKTFAVVGMNDQVREVVDVLALGDQLPQTLTVEEVWRL